MKIRLQNRPAGSAWVARGHYRREPPWLLMVCIAAVGVPQATAFAGEPPSVSGEPASPQTSPAALTQEPPAANGPAGAGLEFGSRLFGQNNGSGLELDGRYRFRSGLMLGALASVAYADHHYTSGLPVDDVVLSRGALLALLPIQSTRNTQMFLRFVHGATVQSAPGTQALRQTNELGAFGHVIWGERNLLRAGVVLGADLEVAPTFELADQYQGLTIGYGYAVSRAVLVYGDGEAGSTYGFNGDNGKVYYGGSLGVRLVLGKEDARGAF